MTSVDLSSLIREAFAEAIGKPKDQVPQGDIDNTLAVLASYGVIDLSSLSSVKKEALERPLSECTKNIVAIGRLQDKLESFCKNGTTITTPALHLHHHLPHISPPIFRSPSFTPHLLQLIFTQILNLYYRKRSRYTRYSFTNIRLLWMLPCECHNVSFVICYLL
jgi:hypothetical protein